MNGIMPKRGNLRTTTKFEHQAGKQPAAASKKTEETERGMTGKVAGEGERVIK